MNNKKQKTFSILELDQEEAYIAQRAKEGDYLVSVENGIYKFTKDIPRPSICIIEIFLEKLPENNLYYENQGLRLVSSFKGKKGYWNYFIGPENESITRRPDDYKKVLEVVMKRYEIFWTIVPLTIIIFGIYMLFSKNNPYFLLLIILPLLIVYKNRGLKKEIKEKLEKE